MGGLRGMQTSKVSEIGPAQKSSLGLILFFTKLKIKKMTKLGGFLPRELAWEKEVLFRTASFVRGECRGHAGIWNFYHK